MTARIIISELNRIRGVFNIDNPHTERVVCNVSEISFHNHIFREAGRVIIPGLNRIKRVYYVDYAESVSAVGDISTIINDENSARKMISDIILFRRCCSTKWRAVNKECETNLEI